jgi:1-acyl-sn-glycerol-3-phosphate acyltransferase
MQNIFVDRSDPQKAVQSIREGVKRLPNGIGIMFFAEGTRSVDGRIGTFKKGGFRTAQLTGFPILPVVTKGSRRVLPKGEMVFRSGAIELVVLDPVEVPAGLSEEKFTELIDTVRNQMIAVFEGHSDPG